MKGFFYQAFSNWNFLTPEEQEEENRKYREKENEEQDRLDKIICPCCKGNKKQRKAHSSSNGIIGPGSNSYITDEYLFCLDCGTMYKDLFKLKMDE